MVDTELDSRIAEAAAAVEALRRESAKLDQQLEQHREPNNAILEASQRCLDDAAAFEQSTVPCDDGNITNQDAFVLAASLEASTDQNDVSSLEEQLRPSTAASLQDVPHCIFWAPAAPPPVASGAVLHQERDTAQHVLTTGGAFAVDSWQQEVVHTSTADILSLDGPFCQMDTDFSDHQALPWDWSAQEEVGVELQQPFAPAPPSKREQTRQKMQDHCRTFPSDEVVASMSRRERIALLEQQGAPPQGDAAMATGSPNGKPFGAAPVTSIDGPFVDAHGRLCSRQPFDVVLTCDASAKEVQSAADENLPRQRRSALQETSRPPLPDYPADEKIAQMSRRERIALLENVEGGNAGGDDGESRSYGREAWSREVSTSRRAEDSAMRCHAAEGRARTRGGAACAPPYDETRDPDDGLEDEAWLEQRRQNRKSRLQRAPRVDSASRDTAPDFGQTNSADSQARMHLDSQETGPAHSERRRAKGLDVSGYSEAFCNGPAEDGQPLHPVTGGRSLLEELEDVARLSMDDPRWVPLCHSISAGAHKLSPGGLVRAIQVVGAVSANLAVDEHDCSTEPVLAFRSVVDAVLVSITPQLGSLSTGVIADALTAMAAAKIQEQSYLDMLLVQLLVLIRRERSLLAPEMLATLAGAIGALHVAGVSAKRAASGASSAANQRCLDALAEQIASSLENFAAKELGTMGGAYLVAFTDDLVRRAALARAAQLGAGLAAGSSQSELEMMQDMERAVRQHSFAFIASLPDQTKDYLMKLKAATSPAYAPY